jgi:potassium channel
LTTANYKDNYKNMSEKLVATADLSSDQVEIEMLPPQPSNSIEQSTSRLLFAAARGDLKGLALLHSQNVNFNLADYDGRTALHIAASNGLSETVTYLLSHGANVNAFDRFGGSPRDDAVRQGHQHVGQLLIAAGANKPSTQFEFELINASHDGDYATVKRLLNNQVSPNCKDYDQRTPLHLAAAKRNLEIVVILLNNGADPNAGTPL